ncbi:winged helix-turn-helix domain-containing protein [Pararhizobium sp.]|uniref:winged helix-turn-helix domain-containing protein n=1 Tax=Pararhizobium sp. TaxID=1977563 RepID=UPI002728CCA1|nr:winged helix-turn-helix domain-containing protein [Pararhizobium sp.]MDO9415708.1 winged helix-turn-helix domain-containing protein [Pararhizobium sp.]
MTGGNKIAPTLRFDFETGARLGPGKAQLLELIAEHGSIRAAGAAIGMSYRRAWMLADETNRMFKEPSVATQHGGKSGGGAVLTAFGTELLARYRAMEDKAAAAYADDLDWLALHMDAGFTKAGKEEG